MVNGPEMVISFGMLFNKPHTQFFPEVYCAMSHTQNRFFCDILLTGTLKYLSHKFKPFFTFFE